VWGIFLGGYMDERLIIGYVRVSTEEQATEGYSLEAQQEKLRLYAQLQGWSNVEMFVESGESAKDMYRPQIKKLLSLIKKNKVKVVMTIAVDRLSRNLLDMLQFVDLCERHETSYVCTSLGFSTATPIGRMILQILSSFAEFERQMISTRVQTTMRDIANKQGRYMSVPPYGYKLDEQKRLEIVPEEAEWLLQAANMFVEGVGFRSVAKWLTEQNAPCRGKVWHSNTVKRMIINELYAGVFVYNRRYYDKDRKMRWRDESEWITQENAHPAIYTPELWAEIQKRAKRMRPGGGTKTKKHRLSGLMRCGHCGSSMTARRYGPRGEKGQKIIYICQSYASNGGCWYNYGWLEEAESIMKEYLSELVKGNIDLTSDNESQIKQRRQEEFDRKMHTLNQRFQKQFEAYEKGLVGDDDLLLARKRIEEERQALKDERDRIQASPASDITLSVQDAAKHALWLWDQGNLDVLQGALSNIFECIEVTDRKVSGVVLAKHIFNS